MTMKNGVHNVVSTFLVSCKPAGVLLVAKLAVLPGNAAKNCPARP
jgi:hypothetical protein